MKKVVVYGAGGHAKVLADIVLARDEMELIGFVDDRDEHPANVLGKPVLGNGEWLRAQKDVHVGLGVGSNGARRAIAMRCKEAGLALVTLIHPAATVSPSARVDEGAVIMAQAVINPEAHVGAGAIINSAAVVEHDCVIGDFAHLSPNSALGGAARVGALSHLGVGVSVLPQVVIGANTTVGAGACVHRDLPDDVVAVGVPAKVIRTKA